MAQLGGGGAATGIRFTVTMNSTDGSQNIAIIEVDSGSGYVETEQRGPGASVYDVSIGFPLDNVTRTVRYKERRTGFADSAYSGTISGKPTQLSGAL